MRLNLLTLTTTILMFMSSIDINGQILDSVKYDDFTHSSAYKQAVYGERDSYSKNLTMFGGPTASISFSGFEFGGLFGATWRDRFAFATFSQW